VPEEVNQLFSEAQVKEGADMMVTLAIQTVTSPSREMFECLFDTFRKHSRDLTYVYSKSEIRHIGRSAFKAARRRGKRLSTLSSLMLWLRVIREVVFFRMPLQC